MIRVWEPNDNATKELQEKCKAMNEAIGLNNIKVDKPITLEISEWCAEHIKTLHKEYPSTEWLAVCKVEPKWNWEFEMVDMIFPWQKWVWWEVETTAEWMDRLTKELVERKEDAWKWNCILHSHHHMGCFWSGTDDKARLWLNDWRTLAWAVVTAYNGDEISYKGCLNFYKPYNIEIDVNVVDADNNMMQAVDEYESLLKIEYENAYADLLKASEDKINELSNSPDYTRVLDYLWIDITDSLVANYETIKGKVNVDLSEFIKQIESEALEIAKSTLEYMWDSNVLNEYSEYCDWSDNLLSQLEQHREKSYSYSGSLYSTTKDNTYTRPSIESYAKDNLRNFDYDDDIYEFKSPQYAEWYVRTMFNLGDLPMKVWDKWEREVWVDDLWEYLYVEDYENYMYSY